MAQTQVEYTTMIQEEITMEVLEELTEKVAQVQARERELAKKFHSLEEAVKGVHTT